MAEIHDEHTANREQPATRPQFNFDRIQKGAPKVTPDLIKAVRDRIVQNLHPEKIVLFGSYANSTAIEGSDIDLLVVLGDQHPLASLKHSDRLGKLLEFFRYRTFGLDIIVLTDVEIEQRQNENEGEWDFVLEVLEEGEPLYESTTKKQTQ